MTERRAIALAALLYAVASACGVPSDADTAAPHQDPGAHAPVAVQPARPGAFSESKPMPIPKITVNVPDGGRGAGGGQSTVEPPTPPVAPWDVVGIINDGQSLSVGTQGIPALTTTQPYNNVRLRDNGTDPKFPVGTRSDKTLYDFVPLTEPPHAAAFTGGATAGPDYPNNLWGAANAAPFGETPASTIANGITAEYLKRKSNITIFCSSTGVGGAAIDTLSKGGSHRSYAPAIEEATIAKAICAAHSPPLTFGVSAVFWTQGENGAGDGAYGTKLEQLISDFNTDLKAVTGQSKDVLMVLTQQSSVDGTILGSYYGQWTASKADPRIVLAGPKYQYVYFTDHLHMPNKSYIRMGEKLQQAYNRTVLDGAKWLPLQPNAAQRISATEILIFLDVPVGPLQWDDTLPLPHQSTNTDWAAGKGFELRHGAAALSATSLAIAAVDIVDVNQVKITAASTLPNDLVWVSYASTADVPNSAGVGGIANGLMGHLCDSDAYEGPSTKTVQIHATNGSPNVSVVNTGDFDAWQARDVVAGNGVAANTLFSSISGDTAVLNQNYAGTTGQVSVKLRRDHRNYLCQFTLSV